MIEIGSSGIGALLTIWGAGVSTALAGIKIWETFWKDRLKLESTFSLTTHVGEAHKITVANLSSLPVQISFVELYWVPNFFPLKRRETDLATPTEYYTSIRKIDGHSHLTFEYSGDDRFDWSYETVQGRRLYMYLHIFGRDRPRRLLIYSPDSWRRSKWNRFKSRWSRFP